MDPKDDPYQFRIPQNTTPPPTSDSGGDAAAAFARAKISAIFNEPGAAEPATEQPSAPALQPASQQPPATPPPPSAFETLQLAPQGTQPGTILPATTSASGQQPTRREQIAQYTANQGTPQKPNKKPAAQFARPLIKSVIVTALVFLVYNAPLVMGQVHYYITPASSQPTPIILDAASGAVSPDPKIIISKLNIDVPAVYDEPSFDEAKIQAALQRGIVHYGSTAVPGQLGNAVYLGHSSNSPWDPGRYKTAFSILRRLEVNDTFIMHYESKRYIYEVTGKRIVEPNDFSVIDQRVSEPMVTLITCDPPGANWKRLVIQARQISPDPKSAQPAEGKDELPSEGGLPGSPASLLDRFREWLF